MAVDIFGFKNRKYKKFIQECADSERKDKNRGTQKNQYLDGQKLHRYQRILPVQQ